MKVSGSVPCSLIAAAYLAAHLAFLPPSLEDIDSINFALGLREFDVARHQPHPPGYPVYMAMARASLAVAHTVAPALEQVRAEALALSFWSALAGAVALLAGWRLFLGIAMASGAAASAEGVARVPLVATVLLASSPLFWITGLRPMSDMAGLAAALTADALVAASWRRRDRLVWGALAAGLAVGVRVQTLWLTAPLLALAAWHHRQSGIAWLLTRPLAAAAAGCLVWAVPLIVASGGFPRYLAALGSQAGEDFAWVDMLWANPTPRHLAFALYETLVLPWGAWPLAVIALTLATAGALAAAARAPRLLGFAAVVFVPYLLFHLLLQETPAVRYALPVVPAVAWLAAYGLAVTGRAAWPGAIAVSALALSTWLPAMLAYAREPHPSFQAIADMTAVAARDRPDALFAHYALRRPLQARTPPGVTFVEPPRAGEWMAMIGYWRRGGTGPVWFLADPRRTDLAVVDPRARTSVRRYEWRAAERWTLNGTRPMNVDWYRFEDPGWFVGEGWSLTPELGGITRLAGNGVDRRPIDAFVRRRPDASVAVVGARHLGTHGDAAAVFTLTIDGRPIDEWALDPKAGPNVLHTVELPAGSLEGSGRYAHLTISARAMVTGQPAPPVAIRQFDVQPRSGLVHAFDDGWHEEEYDNATGLRWRWSSGRSVLRVLPPQAVRLRLRGESPLRYFDAPPVVRVTTGTRVIAEMTPDDDFEWTVDVPADAVRAADGRIAIATDPVYLPGRAEGTADARELGLRLFEIDVSPVQP